MRPVEIAANAFNTLAIFLAGRNSVHTWWTGIVGCSLFGWLFFDAKLYAYAAADLGQARPRRSAGGRGLRVRAALVHGRLRAVSRFGNPGIQRGGAAAARAAPRRILVFLATRQ